MSSGDCVVVWRRLIAVITARISRLLLGVFHLLAHVLSLHLHIRCLKRDNVKHHLKISEARRHDSRMWIIHIICDTPGGRAPAAWRWWWLLRLCPLKSTIDCFHLHPAQWSLLLFYLPYGRGWGYRGAQLEPGSVCLDGGRRHIQHIQYRHKQRLLWISVWLPNHQLNSHIVHKIVLFRRLCHQSISGMTSPVSPDLISAIEPSTLGSPASADWQREGPCDF